MAIVLFTDFGSGDIYVGQVKAVLQRLAPGIAVIDLLHDAPAFNVRASAHLLAAMVGCFAEGSVFLAVVDPGVGGAREAVVVHADGRWYVGPDNGLLSVVGCARARRRLLAHRLAAGAALGLVSRTRPVCAGGRHAGRARQPARGLVRAQPAGSMSSSAATTCPRSSTSIITAMPIPACARAGSRATALLVIGERRLPYARVFSEAAEGEAFWYENSQGLVEIAVNCGSAAQLLGLKIGDGVAWA